MPFALTPTFIIYIYDSYICKTIKENIFFETFPMAKRYVLIF
jgi:hypothetical protein